MSAGFLRNEAFNYASTNSESLGDGLTNGRADAARYVYLTGIMIIVWNAEDVEGIATVHEVTNF